MKEKNEDPPREGCILGTRQSTEQLVAAPQYNQLLVVEVLGYDTLPTRLEIIKDLATSGYGLTVEQLLDEPYEKRWIALATVG